ncbi:hypothetical protein VFA_003205 [Vibrio furnissii CIP 102972]|nr:hypothetical protein VFA_003205 [Vibrio furnissii CIP 102972]
MVQAPKLSPMSQLSLIVRVVTGFHILVVLATANVLPCCMAHRESMH